MASIQVTTKKLNEEITFVWQIPKFLKLHKTKIPNDGKESYQLSAGESLDLPSTWNLSLCFTKPGNTIKLSLDLEESPDRVKSIFAKYSATVNYPKSRKELMTTKVETRAYYPWPYDTPHLTNFLVLNKLKAAGVLVDKDDTLTIHVKMVIYAEDNDKLVRPCSQELLKENVLNRVSKHFQEWLKTGECSDFIIRVKDVESGEYVERKVHRAILSAQSPVFEVMLGSPMSEKGTGIVTIVDLTPGGLDVLLKFLYTGYLPYAWTSVPEEILNAAEKYDLPLLKNYIAERLHEVCTPENASTLYNLAKQHNLPDATKQILIYIQDNLENVLKQI